MKKQLLLATTLALAVFAPGALQADAISDAAPKPVSLGGTSSFDGWTTAGITNPPNTGFPGFPGSGAWPSPIGSNLGGDATLNKTANGSGGGPYPASGSIYFGGFSATVNTNGGQLTVTDATPVLDINTIVFQVEIGEAWTYDFFNHALPTLSYTTSSGTTSGVAADFSSKIVQAFNGTVTMPTGEEPVYVNLWGLQWDLSAVSEAITSYSISFNGVQHAQVYALQLDASSAIHTSSVLPTAVPEPHEYAAAMATLLFALIMFRRRRARAMA